MKKTLSRKNLWDALPIPAKSGIGMILGRIPPAWLLGGRFRATARWLQEVQWWSAEQYREYQLQQVRRICMLAYSRTLFYRRLFDEAGVNPDLRALDDLLKLPTIDKQTLREHGQQMYAVPIHSPGVDYVSTGGTSGTPLYFYTTSRRSSIEYAYLLSSWLRIGYRLGTPMAVFRGRIVAEEKNGLRHEYDPILRHHYYSTFYMTDDNIARNIEHLRTIGPCYLHTYASAAMVIAGCMKRFGIEPPVNIQGIIAESENVYPDQRSALERTFGTRLFSCYGHSEKLVLATECEQSHYYHVWPTYGYFELLDENGRRVSQPGQRGEIVGTGFINTVQPFIRYRTGDYAVYAGDRCGQCGREHVVLQTIEGRWPAGDLVAADGSLISMTSLNVHDDTFALVERFQFHQDTPGRAILKLVPTDHLDRQAEQRILATLDKKLNGRVMVTIQHVQQIAVTSMGKALYVDQRIPQRTDGA